VNKAIEGAPSTVVAVVIDKVAHKKKYTEPRDSYEIALVFVWNGPAATAREPRSSAAMASSTV
jgi:hypothetical protein